MKWRQVAARFNELINEAPGQLRLDSRSESANVRNVSKVLYIFFHIHTCMIFTFIFILKKIVTKRKE